MDGSEREDILSLDPCEPVNTAEKLLTARSRDEFHAARELTVKPVENSIRIEEGVVLFSGTPDRGSQFL
jgi:hypothetical protein